MVWEVRGGQDAKLCRRLWYSGNWCYISSVSKDHTAGIPAIQGRRYFVWCLRNTLITRDTRHVALSLGCTLHVYYSMVINAICTELPNASYPMPPRSLPTISFGLDSECITQHSRNRSTIVEWGGGVLVFYPNASYSVLAGAITKLSWAGDEKMLFLRFLWYISLLTTGKEKNI